MMHREFLILYALQGVVPLGGSQVAQAEGEPKRGLTGCAFVVTHPSVGARSLALGAATAEERDRWMRAIEDASFVYVGGISAWAKLIAPPRGASTGRSQMRCGELP